LLSFLFQSTSKTPIQAKFLSTLRSTLIIVFGL